MTSSIGSRIRRRREARGLSQDALAGLVGRSKRWLLSVEQGQTDPRLSDLTELSVALKLGLGELIGLNESAMAHPKVTGVAAAGMLVDEDDLKRRKFLACIATLSGAALLDLDSLAGVTDASRLDDLRALIRGHAEQWDRVAPSTLFEVFRGHLANITLLLAESQPPDVRRRMQSVGAEAAAFASLTARWLDNRGDALAYLKTSLALAREAGDGPAQAFALLVGGEWHSNIEHGGQGGDPAAALALFEQAEAAAGAGSSPVLRTWVQLRLAEEHAASRRATLAQRHLDQADAFFSTAWPVQESGLFRHWDAALVAGWRGNCTQLAGRPGDAAAILEGVLRDQGPAVVSNRAAVLADLGAAYAQQAQVEQACAALAESFSLATRAGLSERTHRVRGIRQRHLARWRTAPVVRQLDDQMRLAS